MFVDGAEVVLKVGDDLHIPAHTLHPVRHPDADGLTLWLALFFNTANHPHISPA